MLPPRLSQELGLVQVHHAVEVVEGPDFIEVIFPDFPTGPAFNEPATTLLVRVPRAYPDAGLDMFWTDVSLTLAGGQAPQAAEVIEQYAGRSWRRFSWHHNGWNSAMHNLQTYLEFVRRRFRER